MAEIPNSVGFGEVGSTDLAMDFAHHEDDQIKKEASEFVALDIERLSLLAEKDSNSSPRVIKNLSRKGSQRGGEKKVAAAEGGATVHASTGGVHTNEKLSVLVHVAGDGESVGLSHTMTPTSTTGGGKFRRLGRRSSPWLDPGRVLFFFATLSSMGTLILLYFTLSMGKMSGGNADAR